MQSSASVSPADQQKRDEFERMQSGEKRYWEEWDSHQLAGVARFQMDVNVNFSWETADGSSE